MLTPSFCPALKSLPDGKFSPTFDFLFILNGLFNNSSFFIVCAFDVHCSLLRHLEYYRKELGNENGMCSCVLLDGQLLIALTKDEQFHSQKVSSSLNFSINDQYFFSHMYEVYIYIYIH